MFSIRFWGMSALYTIGAALLIGLPTVLIPNPLFRRMAPTSPQDYVIWGISAVLLGLVMALTSLYPTNSAPLANRSGGRALIGTLLSFFSVGCPICNKVIVLLLGIGGAMTFFNPLRPFLGIASIILLSVTLFLRLRVLRSGCSVRLSNTQLQQ